MNPLIAINMAVFAVVFSLFALEAGIALLNLVSYREYGGRITDYIARSWAISGTFVVFYVVNFEATFPLILAVAGTIYIVPVLIAGLFIIFRNAFIAYSDYAGDMVTKIEYTRIYAIATLAAIFILVSVLGSTVTGIGIDLGTLSINYPVMLLSPYNLLMFVCAAAVSVTAVLMFFGIEKPFGASKLLAIASLLITVLATFLLATLSYAPFVAQGLATNWYYLVPAIVMFLVSATMYLTGKKKGINIATFAFLVTTVLGFETLGYPKIFAGALSIKTFLTSASGSIASLIITAGTFAVLVIGVGLLVYAHSKYSKARKTRRYKA